jgi:beta-alanine degradation protein BauB
MLVGLTAITICARSSPTERGRALADPTSTDPDKYKVIFENERVRVLQYTDEPGQATSPHEHPDSVMYTLSSFERRLVGESGESRDVSLEAGQVRWLDAQVHSGENIGQAPTHVLFVELKEGRSRNESSQSTLGPM